MSSQMETTPGRSVRPSLSAFTHVQWLLLLVGSVVCGWVSIFVEGILGVPREAHFNGSLLCGGAAVSAIVAIAVAIPAGLLLGSLIAGSVEFEAGLFCCCLGLAGLGVHCGPIRPVLQYASGSSVYLSLALETAILGAILFFLWSLLQKPISAITPGHIRQMRLPSANEIANPSVAQIAQTVAAQVVITAICELILIQSDATAQAIGAVALSGFLGALGAYLFNPVADGRWYWIGPSIVGVIGYALTFFAPSGLNIGEATGWTAALVRATPLDYAGAGTAGALLGFWCSRRWHQPEVDEPVAAETKPA